LGEIVQSGGKHVHAWAFEGNVPAGWKLQCNTFLIEWPPKSGKYREFPEADKAQFFRIREALEYILPAQKPLLKRLENQVTRR
jgi:predicted NUDIX family NTP pyrophosphohydrolase